ncbi:MAG: hypothetical protein V2I37_04490 [Marinilabiliaceae bacterium]|jgi:hypothetical protein|nr:hypothetical protein [Marinilabiliaceae bacterium]
MRQLGKRLLHFIIPAIIFSVISIVFYLFGRIRVNSEFKDISAYECLIMGDSQMQRINPGNFTVNTYNLASSAEHFYFTYRKLLNVLKNKDHNIKKIVLGAAPHSFSPVYSRLFDPGSAEGKNSLKRYLYYLDKTSRENFVKFSDLPFRETAIGVFRKPEWGGLVESEKADPDIKIVNRTFRMQYAVKGNEDKFSRSQKKYLNMIEELCSASNIDLYICSTPYHKEYINKIDTRYFDYFYTAIRELKNYYHIDFLADEISSDLMSDANHLNTFGASRYSKRINEIIEL